MNVPIRRDVYARFLSRATDKVRGGLKVSLPDVRVWLLDDGRKTQTITYERRVDDKWSDCALADLTESQCGAIATFVATLGWSADPKVKGAVFHVSTGVLELIR